MLRQMFPLKSACLIRWWGSSCGWTGLPQRLYPPDSYKGRRGYTCYKVKTLKLLGESIGNILKDTGTGKDFLHKSPIAQGITESIN